MTPEQRTTQLLTALQLLLAEYEKLRALCGEKRFENRAAIVWVKRVIARAEGK